MRKGGVITDMNRRRKHISKLQDLEAWRIRRELPPANAAWPTCLIIAPSTIVHNWEREFETVCRISHVISCSPLSIIISGAISKLGYTPGAVKNGNRCFATSKWVD